MTRNPVISFDKLQLYFAEPYTIDLADAKGIVTLLQPTIGDIVEMGQKKLYSGISLFVSNTTQYRLPLWELGIDWNKISDFDLFLLLVQQGVDADVVNLLFKDLDFSKFEIKPRQIVVKENDEERTQEEMILSSEELGIEITESVYHHISQYFRNVFNIFPEEKLTKDDTLKEWFINKDKRQREIDAEKMKKGTIEESSLLTLISACVNHPGFKYKTKELKEIHLYEFYDSVKRLQIYESATACMKGLYSGFVNAKDIKPENYNFMKEI